MQVLLDSGDLGNRLQIFQKLSVPTVETLHHIFESAVKFLRECRNFLTHIFMQILSQAAFLLGNGISDAGQALGAKTRHRLSQEGHFPLNIGQIGHSLIVRPVALRR